MGLCSFAHGQRAASLLLLAVGCPFGPASAHAFSSSATGRAPVAGQAQLRASAALPADAEAEERRTIEAAFGAVADVSSADKQQNDVRTKDKSSEPLSMQVSEAELQKFTSALSSSCKSQFSDIMAGKSKLHTFSSGGATASSSETCTKMKGTLCTMSAQVTQKAQNSGRKMKSTTSVSGRSCLPEDCMADNDMKVLTNFMKVKALESMASTADVDIDMHVDCAASVTAAKASGEKAVEDKSAAASKVSDKKESGVKGAVAAASKTSSKKEGHETPAAAPAPAAPEVAATAATKKPAEKSAKTLF